MTTRRSVRGFVSGRVQGVGFRYFVMRKAHAERLGGYVRNLPDGRVEFLLQGEADSVARVVEQIRNGPTYARVSDLSFDDTDDLAIEPEFSIR